MFLDEARLAARLTHPNIVQTIEVGSEGEPPLHGHGVPRRPVAASRIVRPPRATAAASRSARTCASSAEALLGLHYAHELPTSTAQPLGIVHRDVSPLNVFVTFDGQAKVVDFGIAKSIDSSLETQDRRAQGPRRYMAPEQAWGQPVDRRADVYSAGVMLWEAAAGRRSGRA